MWLLGKIEAGCPYRELGCGEKMAAELQEIEKLEEMSNA